MTKLKGRASAVPAACPVLLFTHEFGYRSYTPIPILPVPAAVTRSPGGPWPNACPAFSTRLWTGIRTIRQPDLSEARRVCGGDGSRPFRSWNLRQTFSRVRASVSLYIGSGSAALWTRRAEMERTGCRSEASLSTSWRHRFRRRPAGA